MKRGCAMPASLLKILRTSRVLGAALRRHRVDVVDVMNPASDLPIAVAAAKWAGGLPVAVTVVRNTGLEPTDVEIRGTLSSTKPTL